MSLAFSEAVTQGPRRAPQKSQARLHGDTMRGVHAASGAGAGVVTVTRGLLQPSGPRAEAGPSHQAWGLSGQVPAPAWMGTYVLSRP